jgi:hypothetical protein
MKDLLQLLLSTVIRVTEGLLMSPLEFETKRLKVKGLAFPVIVQVSHYLNVPIVNPENQLAKVKNVVTEKVMKSEFDSIRLQLKEIQEIQQALPKPVTSTERKLPSSEEISEVMDTIGAKLWALIKWLAFWVAIALLCKALLYVLFLTLFG